MIFEIGDDKGSKKFDSLDMNVPLCERFLSFLVFNFISGGDGGVTADQLGCTEDELDKLMDGCDDIDDEEIDRIINFLPNDGNKH